MNVHKRRAYLDFQHRRFQAISNHCGFKPWRSYSGAIAIAAANNHNRIGLGAARSLYAVFLVHDEPLVFQTDKWKLVRD
jgi:hypothetical protein